MRAVVFICLTAVAFSGGCGARKANNAWVAGKLDGRGEADQVLRSAPMLVSEVDKESIGPVSFHISNLKPQTMTIEVMEKSCGCQKVELPEQAVPVDGVAEIGMLIDPPRKAESKAYWATLALVWGTERETVKLRVELEVMPELLTVPTDVSHDFASEEVVEESMTAKQRVRSEAEPEPMQPEFREPPDEVELVAWEQVGMRKIADGDRSSVNGDQVAEGRGQKSEVRDHMSVSSAGAQRSTLDAQCFPIWEIEWRATLRLKVTERVRQSPEGLVGQCVVACGEGEYQRVQIPIRLRCVEAIQASPAHTYFGQVKSGEKRMRTVMLRARDDLEFEISEITCNSAEFSARATTEGAKKLHVLQVLLDGSAGDGSVSGRLNGKVCVTTTHPKCSQVSFTVEGTVENSGQLSVVGGQ